VGFRWVRAGLAAGAVAAAWGVWEAGWVRFRTLAVPVPRLPSALAGLRIVHLSDFHLGVPSRGRRATESAVEWTVARNPDLVLVTGDLLSRRRGARLLGDLMSRLPRCYAILGNHDFAISRDPFAQRSAPSGLSGTARLLVDEGVFVEVGGERVYIAGSDPRSRFVRRRRQPPELAVAPDAAALRILLVHYPRAVRLLPPAAFDLVLAGHMHDGQICVPYPGGKLRLAHPRARYWRGLYPLRGGVLHVSPGLGTTFVPFRFCARPEATELVLETAE
jgi:uncharacterized protein